MVAEGSAVHFQWDNAGQNQIIGGRESSPS